MAWALELQPSIGGASPSQKCFSFSADQEPLQSAMFSDERHQRTRPTLSHHGRGRHNAATSVSIVALELRCRAAGRAGHVLSKSVCLARWFQDCWLEGSLLAGGDQEEDGQDDPQSFGRCVCWYRDACPVLARLVCTGQALRRTRGMTSKERRRHARCNIPYHQL